MAATKNDRSTGQSTRKPGKQRSGWVKVGVYLAPDAAKRLEFAALSKGVDRSEILTNLVLGQLPRYVLAAHVASPVSELRDGPLELIGAPAA
ncbi:MAG: hypothetical protein ACXWN0_10600 [Isosphaeraceae bacterium]